jgi:hypothetical protein
MLDLYLIQDDVQLGDNPAEENHIGAFSLDEFKELKDLVRVAEADGIPLSFVNDFRLSHAHVKVLLEIVWKVHSTTHADSAVTLNVLEKLGSILNAAGNKGHGIAAYCD